MYWQIFKKHKILINVQALKKRKILKYVHANLKKNATFWKVFRVMYEKTKNFGSCTNKRSENWRIWKVEKCFKTDYEIEECVKTKKKLNWTSLLLKKAKLKKNIGKIFEKRKIF